MIHSNRLIGADCRLYDIHQEIERLAGGIPLKELINKGMLVDADGNPFVREGEELGFEENQQRYNEPEAEALMAAKTRGVFLYTDMTKADTKPILIHGDETEVSYTDPIEPEDMENAVKMVTEPVDEPARVSRPGLWNRIKNVFKPGGTPEMNKYNQYKKDLQKYNEYRAKVAATAEKLGQHGADIAYKEAEKVHTKKDIKQVVNLGVDLKARYDRMNIPACEVKDGEVSKVNDLLTDTKVLLAPVHLGILTKFVDNPAKVKKGLAAMTALDLVLRERRANGYVKGDEQPVIPGPIEQKLNNMGETKFIDYIAENPVFKDETKVINSKMLDEFVSKNKATELSGKVFSDIKKNELGINDENVKSNDLVNEKVENKEGPSFGAFGS